MSFLQTLFHSRDKPKNFSPGAGRSYLFGPTTAGEVVTEQTAMQTTAVYACVRILSESIASLPLHVYRRGENGNKERDFSHPLDYILHNEPNREMTAFVWRETLTSHLLLYGNAYAQIIRNGFGQVLELYPLLPDRMTVDRDRNGSIFYRYQSSKGTVCLRCDEVLHIPGLGFDGLVGYSPIAMAKNAVGMAIACEKYGAAFFANGATPGGVLEHPGTIKDVQRLKDNWNTVYQGTGNSHKVAVLEEGMTFKQMSIPPEEAQFLETRKFQINEIARLYRVPPHMVGDLEKSSYSNIEQQSLEFVKYTLDPWVVRWEQSLQRALLNSSEKKTHFIKLNVDGLLRGDYASRMAGYATARQNGWMSSNDIRELEDMNKIPAELGGDLYLVNGAMTKLEDAGAFAGIGKEETA